jgi:hypothetical protein
LCIIDGIKCATFKTRTSKKSETEENFGNELKAENELNSQEYENTFRTGVAI